MPTVEITTNLKPGDLPGDFAIDINRKVAEVLNKPAKVSK